jgi:hypothetical protein
VWEVRKKEERDGGWPKMYEYDEYAPSLVKTAGEKKGTREGKVPYGTIITNVERYSWYHKC